MWQAIKQAYGDSWQFAKAFPLLVGIVILTGGAQHVVEWSTGFYASMEAMHQAEANWLRMALGAAKAVSIVLVGYWVARYLLSNGSRRFTTASDLIAMRRYGVAALAYVLITVATVLIIAMAGAQLVERTLLPIMLLFVGAAIRTLLSFWIVGAAVAEPAATLRESVRRTRGSLLWGAALTISGAIVPLSVHYALSYGAAGAPRLLAGAILVMDALLVGFLGVLAASLQVQVARRVSARSGHSLSMTAVAAE
ncbi:MAG TPA: hypothetical protein VIG90_19430 [Pedomonas sp.]|uniref:hypothetical protein n=1 Tax=Pedomonas sp. TaxID=2976421 RepID=UPI002F3E51DE